MKTRLMFFGFALALMMGFSLPGFAGPESCDKPLSAESDPNHLCNASDVNLSKNTTTQTTEARSPEAENPVRCKQCEAAAANQARMRSHTTAPSNVPSAGKPGSTGPGEQ